MRVLHHACAASCVCCIMRVLHHACVKYNEQRADLTNVYQMRTSSEAQWAALIYLFHDPGVGRGGGVKGEEFIPTHELAHLFAVCAYMAVENACGVVGREGRSLFLAQVYNACVSIYVCTFIHTYFHIHKYIHIHIYMQAYVRMPYACPSLFLAQVYNGV